MSDVDDGFREWVVDYPFGSHLCAFRAGAEWQRRQERREDDDEPVDCEWLESVGLQDWAGMNARSYGIGGTPLLIRGWPDEWPKQWRFAISDHNNVIHKLDPTRGDVRSLTAVFGIALADARERG